jgi:hypothetical protein
VTLTQGCGYGIGCGIGCGLVCRATLVLTYQGVAPLRFTSHHCGLPKRAKQIKYKFNNSKNTILYFDIKNKKKTKKKNEQNNI